MPKLLTFTPPHHPYLPLPVHHEPLYQTPSPRADELGGHIKKIMESVLPAEETRGVPILAVMKSGPNWGSMHTP